MAYVYMSDRSFAAVSQLRDGHAVVLHCLTNKLMRGGGAWSFDLRKWKGTFGVNAGARLCMCARISSVATIVFISILRFQYA